MNGKKYIIAALSALLTIFTLPFSAAGQSKYRDVSAGLFHVLTLKNDGSVWAMGANRYGQLGDGTTTMRKKPVKVMDNAVAVAAGGIHSLAIDANGALWAWGDNESCQLGNGTQVNALRPVKIMDGV